jgi:hypothetical protein
MYAAKAIRLGKQSEVSYVHSKLGSLTALLVSEEKKRMKAFSKMSVPILLLFCAFSLAAAPIGNLSTGITPSGGVTGNATTIDWYLPTAGGFGDFTTGSTNISYSGGTVTGATNAYGRITDLSVFTLGATVVDFIQFYNPGTHNAGIPGSGTMQTFPTFDLLSVGPGVATPCNVDPGLNQECSPAVTSPPSPFPYTSPIVLTQRANGTDVSMNLNLLGRDADGSISWTGLVTAQVAGMTPSQIQAAINANQTINLQSWSLNANAIPEPATLAFVGSGLVLLGVVARRRKK